MAAAANQAHRFLVAGGVGGGAGSFDACNRILADLCTTGNPKVILCSVCSCRLKALTAVGDWFIRGDARTTCALEGFLIFQGLEIFFFFPSCTSVCFLENFLFRVLTNFLVLQEGATLALRKYVEEEARELSNEVFSRFMDQLYDRITSLLENNDPADNLGALRVIDELIDVPLGEDASKVSRFSNYMKIVFEGKRDQRILVLASNVLGHLARACGAMAADEMERQVFLLISFY